MPDLNDGESVEMKGSGAKPYVLKNVGGVYSCTCPAWRNQSIAIERRTCKHLRKLRGDKEEEARVGQDLPARPERGSPEPCSAKALYSATSRSSPSGSTRSATANSRIVSALVIHPRSISAELSALHS